MCKFSKIILSYILISIVTIQVHASSAFVLIGQLTNPDNSSQLSNITFITDFLRFGTWIQIVHCIFWAITIFLLIMLFLNWRIRKKLNEKTAHFIQAIYDLQKPLEMVKGPLEELSKEDTFNETQKTKLDVAIWSTSSIQSTISFLLDQAKSDRYFKFILNSTAGKKLKLKEKIQVKVISYKQEKEVLDISNHSRLPEKENKTDFLFMEKLLNILKTNMEDSNFTIDTLSQKIGMSRSSLYHKIKDISGLAPADFIRLYRLEKAKELLELHQYSVSEVAYKTGFSDAKYFRAVFKKQYQIPPGFYSKKV